MNLQDLLAADHIGVRYHHLAIETAGPQQRWVEHVRTIGSGDHDYTGMVVETVHLDQDLIERLLPLIIGATQSRTTLTTDGVNFVDEDNARCTLASLVEQVSHTACPDADEHFDKFGSRDPEKRHAGFACHGACQKRFARARRPDELSAINYTVVDSAAGWLGPLLNIVPLLFFAGIMMFA